MSKGIDYSKWDHMQWSDDDDDDDGDDNGRQSGATPRVTRLEAPSSVSCTNTGDIVIQERNTETTPPQQKDGTTPHAVTTAASTTTTQSGSSTKPSEKDKPGIPDTWTEKGSVCEVDATFDQKKNKKKTRLYWTQDRSTVTMRFALPPDANTRGWDCHVQGILSYDNRATAVGTPEKARLIILPQQGTAAAAADSSNKSVVLDQELPYPVHLPQDDDQVDWGIERIGDENKSKGEPFLCVTLFKATPMAGMVLWWNRPLMQCPELDKMEWRETASANKSSSPSFQDAWDEAHRMFLEKRSKEK